jgi:hypothetical protein
MCADFLPQGQLQSVEISGVWSVNAQAINMMTKNEIIISLIGMRG